MSENPVDAPQEVTEIDILDAVQMLIKSVVNLSQRVTLLEMAMGQVQARMNQWSDDGR